MLRLSSTTQQRHSGAPPSAPNARFDLSLTLVVVSLAASSWAVVRWLSKLLWRVVRVLVLTPALLQRLSAAELL